MSMTRAGRCLVLLLMSACDQLWGKYVEPNPENCATSGSACPSGTSCNLSTGSCEPVDGGTTSPPPTSVCDAGGFCWENPLPQGNDLYRAFARTNNDVWFVGSFGTILNENYDPPIRTHTDPRMEMSCKLPRSLT